MKAMCHHIAFSYIPAGEILEETCFRFRPYYASETSVDSRVAVPVRETRSDSRSLLATNKLMNTSTTITMSDGVIEPIDVLNRSIQKVKAMPEI